MHSKRVLRRLQLRRESAFVADRGRKSPIVQHAFQRVKNFRAVAQRFPERGRAFRHDHEFLEIDRRIGMRAAVQDIHHRHRQDAGRVAAEITEERNPAGRRGGVGGRERYAQERVCAQVLFVGSAIERDDLLIDLRLLERIEAGQRGSDHIDYAAHRFRDAFSAEALLVAIAQFPRLMLAGAGAARNGRAPHRAAFQMDIDFDGGIAARIQDLARVDFCDARGRHTCDALHQLPRSTQCCFRAKRHPVDIPIGNLSAAGII